MSTTIFCQYLIRLTLVSGVIGTAWASGITSPLTITAKSGDSISYQITSYTGGDAYHGAVDLPAGLTCSSSGLISGAIHLSSDSTADQTISTYLYVSSENEDTADDYLVWSITPILQATANPGVSHGTQHLGQSVALTRNGSAYNGITWSETTVFRPDGSAITTSYAGLGSASYIPDGGIGWYRYRLKVGDATGAAAVGETSFYAGKILAYTVPGSYPVATWSAVQVGQGQSIYFDVRGPGTPSATAVTVNSALDSVSTISAGPSGLYTAFVRALSRGSGSHWIYLTAANGNWWGDGLFMPVNRAAPQVTFADRTFTANGAGSYTLSAGDLNGAFSNPFTAALSVGNVSQAYYRLGYSGVILGAGTVLTGGVHFVDLVYPGNDDYLPAVTRVTFSVEGPVAPRFLRAVPTGATTVQISWRGVTEGATYQVQRNGVTIGTTGDEFFDDTGATAGANTTYSVRTMDGSLSSVPATVTINALEIHTPTT